MKNQYVGDIGDYGKYSLLRFLALRGVKIGINWYLSDKDESSDGRFTGYLKEDFERALDPIIYDALKTIVDTHDRSSRSVQMIQEAGLIPNALFFSEKLSSDRTSTLERARERCVWFDSSKCALWNADLIFADPDNGISFTKTPGRKGGEKYVFPEEIAQYYFTGKDVVFYCHKGRRTDEAWERTINRIREYTCDAQLFVLTYHRGTQRSYIFVTHPEHTDQYESMITAFVSSTPWGKRGVFTREKSIETIANTAPITCRKDAVSNYCRTECPTGFAAPTIGTVLPRGSTLKWNEDGTVTVVFPSSQKKG